MLAALPEFRWYHIAPFLLAAFAIPFFLGIGATLAWQKWVPGFTIRIEKVEVQK